MIILLELKTKQKPFQDKQNVNPNSHLKSGEEKGENKGHTLEAGMEIRHMAENQTHVSEGALEKE